MQFTVAGHTIDPAAPLIYMWEIHDQHGGLVGRYIGKAQAGARRPTKHYERNVNNILGGRPYRKGKPEGYRRVHRALAQAHEAGHAIRLYFLCNVGQEEDINVVEQRWIKEKNCLGSQPWQLNG